MKRSELEHLIRAAGRIAGGREIVVIGSQAVLGQFPDAPVALLASMEADLYPKNDPGLADKVDGAIGEGSRFHEQYGTTVEEMESASAAQIAGLFHIPFLAIRVVSNNIMNGEIYDTKVGEACQDYVQEVVKAYIAGGLKR